MVSEILYATQMKQWDCHFFGSEVQKITVKEYRLSQAPLPEAWNKHTAPPAAITWQVSVTKPTS